MLGRKIKFIQEDGASDWPTFAEKAKKLLVNDKVAAIMGCWTSASRKAVLPVIEQYNGMLYYPTFYEGLEQSKNVIYTGQEATQQILAGLNWIAKEKGAKSFFFIGSDYIWPRTSNKIARKHVENVLKGKVVGEEYYRARQHPVQFGHQQDQADQARRDLHRRRRRFERRLLQAAQGGRHRPVEAGAADDLGDRRRNRRHRRREHRGRLCLHEVLPVARQCRTTRRSLPAFKKMWGEKTVIGDVTQAAYLGPWLWKLTVEKAGSFDVDKIAAASPGIEFKGAPEGYVRIHENHHLWSKTRVGKAKLDGQFELIFETADLVEPDPFPKGYQ